MSIISGIRMFCLLMAMMAFQCLRAQHYIFIEADGQQPFYLKQGNTMVSSSAAGFLILPKIKATEMEFSIGFPKNVYPEVAFYINGTDRDRGFQLKQMEGQGWSLFDRTSLEVIKGEVPQSAPIEMKLPQKEEGSFAQLLATATDDKSLLERIPKKDSVEKASLNKSITKAGLPTFVVKSGLKDSLGTKDKVILPPISISAQMEDTGVKRLVYVEKTIKGTDDTIAVDIEKKKIVAAIESFSQPKDGALIAPPSNVIANPLVSPDTISHAGKPIVDTDSSKTNVQVSKASPIIVCDRPIADYKDIRALQKKLLGIATDEDQRNYAVKAFGRKCFNTKQALEIGWFFVDETSRLQLFKSLKPLIADKDSFGNLEVSFLKEENITAFRALVAGSN
ncbi:MAG: hypothetical protein K9I92_03745 [Chitinophagaceae bacterium]|nr:hypothetical protein [Chitinophagaceae bacterium]